MRANARPIDFAEPFNRCAGTRKRGPAPINPQIMIAVRLRPWDLRLATGPITYPPPYRRICVAGRANLLTDNVYAHSTWNESMDLWNRRENRRDRWLLSIELFPFDESFRPPSMDLEFTLTDLEEEKILRSRDSRNYRRIYEKWNAKWEKFEIRGIDLLLQNNGTRYFITFPFFSLCFDVNSFLKLKKIFRENFFIISIYIILGELSFLKKRKIEETTTSSTFS